MTLPMHPIVREIVNTEDRLTSILEKYYDKDQYLETVFLKMLQSVFVENVDEQIYLELDQAIVKGHPDTGVYFIFISNAIGFTSRRKQLERANVIHSIGASLSSENLHPMIQAFFSIETATLRQYEGNHAEKYRLAKQSIALVDKKLPRYRNFLTQFAYILAYEGRLKDLDKEDLDLLNAPQNDVHAFLSIGIKLTSFIKTGIFKEGFSLVDEYRRLFLGDATYLIKGNIVSLKILSGDFDENNYEEEYYKLYVNICSSLALGKVEEALKYYQLFQKGDWKNVVGIFEKYFPLHIELCLKNKGKARLLLQELQKRDGNNYLDDIFLARIQLLELNMDGAFQTFGRLMENVKRYGAMNRLVFELQFAKEIKASDLLLLMNGINEKGSINFPKIKEVQSMLPIKTSQGVQLLIGESLAIMHVKDLVKKFANLKEPVLITGETGTGKELVARAIHEEGAHPKEPFLAINCGALTESLLQSELFGYVAGAFTGAQKERKGIFEAAGLGTVFLDEFGDISPKMQVSLLRVLESNEIRLIGGTSTRQIACKIVIVTNIDLHQAVNAKKFREDLYFRLARFDIKLPPLRARVEDIPQLINYFLEDSINLTRKQNVSSNLLRALIDYRWPGNIRELKNEIERLKILHAEKEILDLEDFDFSHLQGSVPNNLLTKNESNENESDAKPSIKPEKELDEEQISKIIKRGNKIDQRHEFIKKLFRKYKKLTRLQIIEIANVSPVTAATDLKFLCKSGFIIKRTPTKSFKSHYFDLVE